MPYGLYISAEGAMAQSRRLDVLSNNLANADSPGFKRDVAMFRARFAEAIERGEILPGTGAIDDVGGGVLVEETVTDFSPGPLKRTGIKSDFAIDGPGFFVVRKDGHDFLTRAGNFLVHPDGMLTTPTGYQVLDEAGTPIVIPEELGPWELTADGAIQQGGDVTALALVHPKSFGDLAKVGENLWRPLAEPAPVDPATRRVVSGFLEQSGVKPTLEMMELIETSRAFEANINLIKSQDDMLGQLINRVLKR